MDRILLVFLTVAVILGISLYFYNLETTGEDTLSPVKKENVVQVPLQTLPLSTLNIKKPIKLVEDNKLVFDYFLNKNHPNKKVYLKLVESNFEKRSALSKQFLDKKITEREFLNSLARVINEFRDNASKLFTDKEFETLFGVSKETDFALTLNIGAPSVYILKNISNF